MSLKPSMINYIYDQPRALNKIFEERNEYCDPFVEILKNSNIKRIYFVGSGTSYHAALSIRNYIENYLEIEASVVIPTVFTRYERIDPAHIYKNEEILVIGISQSGTSLSTIDAIKHAKACGYHTIAFTEALDSLITKESEYVIHLACGKEEIPIETRGYSVTVLSGLLWAIEGGYALHKLSKEEYENLLEQITQTISQLESVLQQCDEWYAKNKYELITMPHGSIAGYGNNYASALEAGLKLYETFHKPISTHELEEMIHGFEMAFDHTHYIFMMVSEGIEKNTIPKFREFFDELTQHQFVITTCQDVELRDHDLCLYVNEMKDLNPILYVLPFQVIAARNCEAIGYDTAKYPHKRRSFSHKRD